MRHIPEPELEPWNPPTYTVDDAGKVVGAQPGTPHNWGRWGVGDQRGTANLLTPDRAAAAARLVRTGRQFSLGLPLGHGVPNVGSRVAPMHLFTSTTADYVVGDRHGHGLPVSDDVIVLPLQASTQLDGHGHFGQDHVLYNGYWQGLVTAASGARRLGIHHHAGGITGRGVLLDVTAVLEIDPFEVAITAAMLDDVAVAHGVAVDVGDIVLVRTGHLGTWLSTPELRRRRRHSGLALDTIQWLADHDVAMVAADNATVEVIPGPPDGPLLPWHTAALRDLGLLVGELFDLDELAADCADDGVYEFMFVAAPLPVVYAVGSPLNPIAIK